MVKYNADQEITNIYENLQIVWSHFFTDMLLFIYIQATLNIYWLIVIRIRCQQIPMKRYSVTFDYSQYLVGYSMSNTKGNFKLFAPTYPANSNVITSRKVLWDYPHVHTRVKLYSRVGSWPYPQTLNLAGKACQGQTL